MWKHRRLVSCLLVLLMLAGQVLASLAESIDSNLVQAPRTVSAAVKAGPFSVTYEANGGSGPVPVDANQYYEGDSVTVDFATLPTRGNHTFLGWSTAPGADAAQYTASNNKATMGTAALVLYAIWKQDPLYTLSYDANGGAGPVPQSQAYAMGSSAFVEAPDLARLTKAGHTFRGWGNSATATRADYAPGSLLPITGDVTLYAVWGIGPFTITYEGNGHTGGSLPASETVYAGAQHPVAFSPLPTKTDHDFAGWADHGDTYSMAGQQILTMPQGDVTLTAQWVSDKAVLTLDADGGSFAGGATLAINVPKNTLFTIPDEGQYKPVRSGSIFLGWASSQGATFPQYASDGTGLVHIANDPVTLYAVWAAATPLSIDFYGNGVGVTVPTAITAYPGQTVPLPFPAGAFERYGKRFLGWSTNPAATQPEYTAGGGNCLVMGNASVTLCAIWDSPSETRLTFTSRTGGLSVIMLPAGTPFQLISIVMDYQFQHWRDRATSHTYNAGLSITVPDYNMDFEAVYSDPDGVEMVPVTFYRNFGATPEAYAAYSIAKAVTIRPGLLPGPQQDGFTFLGWSNSAGDTAPTYLPGSLVSMTVNAEVSLYAIWAKDSANPPKVSLGFHADETTLYNLGDEVVLTVSLRNSGPGPVAGTLEIAKAGVRENIVLAGSSSSLYVYNYQITAADLGRGWLDNRYLPTQKQFTATFTQTTAPTLSVSKMVVVAGLKSPALTIEVTPPNLTRAYHLGETYPYTVTLINAGDAPLTQLQLEEYVPENGVNPIDMSIGLPSTLPVGGSYIIRIGVTVDNTVLSLAAAQGNLWTVRYVAKAEHPYIPGGVGMSVKTAFKVEQPTGGGVEGQLAITSTPASGGLAGGGYDVGESIALRASFVNTTGQAIPAGKLSFYVVGPDGNRMGPYTSITPLAANGRLVWPQSIAYPVTADDYRGLAVGSAPRFRFALEIDAKDGGGAPVPSSSLDQYANGRRVLDVSMADCYGLYDGTTAYPSRADQLQAVFAGLAQGHQATVSFTAAPQTAVGVHQDKTSPNLATLVVKASGQDVTQLYHPRSSMGRIIICAPIKVQIVWNDSSNAKGLRPGKITVGLLAGQVATGQQLDLSQTQNWLGVLQADPSRYDLNTTHFSLALPSVKHYALPLVATSQKGDIASVTVTYRLLAEEAVQDKADEDEEDDTTLTDAPIPLGGGTGSTMGDSWE